MNATVSEVARLFSAAQDTGINFGSEVYPGYSGLVIQNGGVSAMTWGFPLVLTGKNGQRLKPKPVNNARADKLSTPFWRASFEARRCLIPISAWAEAEGPKGQKTRTWYSLPDPGLFAVAGIWRQTAEWGNAFSMVMVDGNPQMAEVHDRMPVLLLQDHWQRWLGGEPSEALALCQPWAGKLAVDRTAQRWVRGASLS